VLAFIPLVSTPVRAATPEANGGAVPSFAVAPGADERSSTLGSPRPESVPPPTKSQMAGGGIEVEPESLGGTLFTTVLSLGAIVVLIYLTLNVGLRRVIAARGLPFARSGLVKVIERVMLDPKRALFVVEAAGEYLLVGGADQGLSLIARLNADEVARVLHLRESQSAQPSLFLQKLLSRKGDAPPAGKA
jgi:flagellar protein FliO/FliZ